MHINSIHELADAIAIQTTARRVDVFLGNLAFHNAVESLSETSFSWNRFDIGDSFVYYGSTVKVIVHRRGDGHGVEAYPVYGP